jgi:hypothetical protein
MSEEADGGSAMTAVLQRAKDDELETHIVYGRACRSAPTRWGDVVLFASDQIVAYLVRANHRARLFVFRTLARPEPLGAQIPGVSPAVRLLMEAQTGRRIYRVRRLFALLNARGIKPAQLSDRFYLRGAALFTSRVSVSAVVESLLRDEKQFGALGES